MEILILILLSIILFVAWIVFVVFAVIYLSRLSKEISVKNIRNASIFSVLGFGWLIGLIVYFNSIKPKADQYEETKSVELQGFFIGLGIQMAMFLLMFLPFMLILPVQIYKTTERIQSSVNAPSEKSTTTDENASANDSSSLFINKEKTFSINFPCQTSEIKTETSENLTIYGCKEKYAVLYGELGSEDLTSENIQYVLDESVNKAFAAETIIVSENGTFKGVPARTIIAETTGGLERVYDKAFIRRNSSGVYEMWQIMVNNTSESDIDAELLKIENDDFASTFEFLK